VLRTDLGIEKEIEVDSPLDEFFLESGDPSILVTHILRSHAGLENPIYPNRRDIFVPRFFKKFVGLPRFNGQISFCLALRF
jgi:hypothetical protein